MKRPARRRHTPWPAVVCAMALPVASVASGCRAPTQVTLEVTTDIDCREHGGTSITVGVDSDVEGKAPAAETTTCTGGRVGSLVLVPSGDTDAEIAVRIVTGVGRTTPAKCVDNGYAVTGCIVSRRVVRYVAHTSLRVPVAMRGACQNIACGLTTTCVNGVCRDPVVDPAACATSRGCDESVLEVTGDR